MMIFNWVNRKLHQKDEPHQFGGDGNIKGKQEYHLNYKNMLYDDITEWSADNILAIGTLGFGHDLGFEDQISTKREDTKEANWLINNVDDDIDSHNVVQDGHDLIQYDGIKPMKKMKEERTTLADLFSAEYSCDSDTIKNNHKNIPITATKYDKSGDNKRDYMTAKKLVPLPVKKFHKMMKRMLNRKIHPELIGKLDIIQNDGESKSFQQDDVGYVKSMSLVPNKDVV